MSDSWWHSGLIALVLCGAFAVGAGLQAWSLAHAPTVPPIDTANTSNTPPPETLPFVSVNGWHAVDPGDSRIRYVALPTSAISPLVALNGQVIFVAGDNDGLNWLYRVDAQADRVTREPFPVEGQIDGLVAAGSALVALSHDTLTAVYPGGSTASVTIPGSTNGIFEVRGIFADGNRVIAIRPIEQAIYLVEVGPPMLSVRRLPTPADLLPPTVALALTSNEVLIWAPVGPAGNSPGGGILDLDSGRFTEVSRTSTMPVSALRGARVAVTEHANPQQIAFDRSSIPMPPTLPLAEGVAGTRWLSTDLSRSVVRVRNDGSQESFALPVFEYITSCPPPPPEQQANCHPIQQSMLISAAATTGTDALVFLERNVPPAIGVLQP